MTAVIILAIMIIAGILYQHIQGTLLRSVISILNAVIAAVIAFSFFELIASLLISRGSSASAALSYWQPMFFLLLSIVSFALLEVAASKLARKSITFDPLTEKIAKPLFGAVSGFIFAGLMIVAVDMAPFGNNMPYQRFSSSNPNPDKPNKSLVNSDGLVTGLFGIVSKGSLAGKTSFTTVHPSFVDEVFLNRLADNKKINLVTPSDSFEVPQKAAAWPAPENIKYADGTNITAKTGHELIVVRLGIMRKGANFSLSQIRLICNDKADESLRGPTINVYPLGYFISQDSVQKKPLGEHISVLQGDYKTKVKFIDFLFSVPATHSPVLAAFKQNNIEQLPKLISKENAPEAETF